MVELSRRFFLGGAIALVAAKTFEPTLSLASNMPTIKGRLDFDDSAGFNALFANEPVIFNKDQIGIESHEGIIFYKGVFRLDKSLSIIKKSVIEFQGRIILHCANLPIDEPVASFERGASWNTENFGMRLMLNLPEGHKVPLFLYKGSDEKLGRGNFDLKGVTQTIDVDEAYKLERGS